MNVEVKEFPSQRVVAVPHRGPYHQIGGAFERLLQWAGPKGLIGTQSPPLGVYYDDPMQTPEDELRSAACIAAPDVTDLPDGFGWRELDGGEYAVARTEVFHNDFAGAWMRFNEWLQSNGTWRHTGGPCFEFYLNNAMEDPEKKWILDLCAPVLRIDDDTPR